MSKQAIALLKVERDSMRYDTAIAEIEKLMADRDALLSALSDLLYYSDDVSSPKLYGNAVDAAREAIARAEQ